jgi:hypothetical protein
VLILISTSRISATFSLSTRQFIASLTALTFISLLYTSAQLVFASSSVVTFGSVWALCYFSNICYILLTFSIVSYLLPNALLFSGANSSSSASSFISLEGQDIFRFLISPFLTILFLHVVWSGPVLTAWFGHIVFSSFQYKVTYLLFFFAVTYLLTLTIVSHYSSVGVYDFTLVTFNFFFWVWLTFFSNNVFTFIFFVEILSASITLLLVTSTFSSSHFYNNTSYTKHNYFSSSTPIAFLQTLLFFFWITLVSSIFLFVFLLVFYLKILSFDWALTDSIVLYLFQTSSLTQLFGVSLCWLLLLICVFIKCGTVPFYFWKPNFFKGMSLTSLFFYVYVYYFSIFLYFVYILFFYLNELFFLNIYLLVLLVVIATLGISVLLFESFYLKSFLALSSILNSILIFLAMTSYQSSDLLFLL